MTMERTFLLFLLEVTAKATAIVGLAGLACWMLGRASAAVRHFIWVVTILGVLVLPALTLVTPKWSVNVPALRGVEGSAPRSGLTAMIAEPVPPITLAAAPAVDQPAPRARSRRVAVEPPITTRPIPSPATATSPDPLTASQARSIARSAEQPITRSFAPRMSLTFVLLVLWVAGAAIALCRFFAGHLRLWWIQRHTDPITDPVWLDLSRRVAHQLRLSRMVRLLRCRRPTMPICWGVRRPSLLLPSDADTWTVERRQVVLLHELAHAKRRDCLTQAIAQITLAVHWFNPLVWLAVRRLRAERERACDDLVLVAGASAPDYADHLLEIARTFRTAGCPSWAGVAMARPSHLEGRLLAILDRHRDRRTPTGRACAGAAAVALAMVGTLAAVQPAPAPAQTDARSSSQGASKSRPDPTPADASGTATRARPMPDGQAVPSPAPRPAIVPKIDFDFPELDELELQEKLDGIGRGVGTGIGEGIGTMKLLDAEERAMQATESMRVEAEQSAQWALWDADIDHFAWQVESVFPKLAPGERDNRPEADPRIVAALATALKDHSPDVRRQAAMTLSQVRSAQAVDALIAATTDADKAVRQFAVLAISRHRSDAVANALVRALKDSDVDVRQAAMQGVARLRDPQHIDVFAEALKDSSPDVRRQAARALAAIGDARAIDPLVAGMKDVDGGVRQQIVQALGQIGQRAARAGKGRE